MSEYVLHMPDVGEGVAEAELVEWHVKPGDPVREDTVLAAVMTDKATVEIPSPVAGVVTWLAAEVGDLVAVKAPLVRIEIADHAATVAALAVTNFRDASPSERSSGPRVTSTNCSRPYGTATTRSNMMPRRKSRSSSRRM